MFRIAFIIGLILTAFSLSVTASPLPQAAANEKQPDDRYMKMAKRLINRYDKDDDQKLSKQEWQKLLLNPTEADANQDQEITATEYATWARALDRDRRTKAATLEPTQQKAEQEKREEQLIEQIERQLEQRERRETEGRERRETEGRDIKEREVEQRERREMQERERREIEGREAEQRERREMQERERREIEQNRQREMEHHAQRGDNGHWENEFRKLEEARALLHREREESTRKFGDEHPRRHAIQRELDEIEGVMKRMFHERGDHDHGDHDRGDHDHGDHDHGDHDRGDHDRGDHDRGDHDDGDHDDGDHDDGDHDHGDHDHGDHDHGDHDHGDHDRGDHRNRERDHREHGDREHHRQNEMPAEQRLELLRVAYDHLNEAGMHDLAEETKRRGEELEQQLRRDNGHGNDQMQRLIEESHRAIHAVNQRLDQVQRELQEMREQFNQLRDQR